MANKRIKDLPGDAVPNKNDILAVDSLTTRGVTIENAVKIGRPFASQAQAEGGIDYITAMNPLTTKQAIAAQGATSFATAAQGAKADSAVQPTLTITAGTGLTGGGTLAANRTLALSSASIASLALADSAIQAAGLVAYAAPIAQAVPIGGATGQVLGKASGADNDVSWQDAGAGDMIASTYDPQGIEADAFNRANHTGANIPDDESVTAAKLDVSDVRPAINAGEFNVLDYGALSTNATAQNKTALQAAIAACDAAGGGVVVNPWPIDWGYNLYDPTTYPDFSGVANDMMVRDFGPASEAYTSEGAKQGWVESRWFHTPPTTPAGQHDGNGLRVHADWHPYMWVDAAGGYIPYGGGAGGRTSDFNLRASYFLGYNGKTVWQICQGVTGQGNKPDSALLGFAIIGYNDAGPGNEYYPLVVNYADGSAGYGIGTGNPDAAHYFHHPASVAGKDTVVFGTDGTKDVTHRFQRGTTYDATKVVTWRLTATNFNLEFPDLGNAIQINRASRNIVFGGSISKASGTFDIPHPDPAKPEGTRLRHSFVESPTRGDNIYRFTVEAEFSSKAATMEIPLPDYWPHLNENPQVWIAADDNFGQAFGKVNAGGTAIVMTYDGTPGSYNVLLIGTRCDEIAKTNFDPLGIEYEASPN